MLNTLALRNNMHVPFGSIGPVQARYWQLTAYSQGCLEVDINLIMEGHPHKHAIMCQYRACTGSLHIKIYIIILVGPLFVTSESLKEFASMLVSSLLANPKGFRQYVGQFSLSVSLSVCLLPTQRETWLSPISSYSFQPINFIYLG